MRLFWKAAACAICIAAICLVAFLWRIRKVEDEQKLTEERRVCRIRAEQGDAFSQYSLALMYHQGKGLPLDYGEALRWYRKAAAQGNAKAQYGLGYMCFEGQGVSKDYTESLRWYRKAADQGDAKAQYSIGLMYYHGLGVPLGYAEAARWYRQAADHGLAKAEYDLGYLYYHGQGVPEDRNEADRWFQKAADQGNIDAQHALGLGFTTWRVLILFGQLTGGILLTVGLLIPRKVRWNIQTKGATIAGVLCFMSAGMSWYGFTHSTVCWMLFGFNAFKSLSIFLNVVLIVLLFSIFRSGEWRPEIRV